MSKPWILTVYAPDEAFDVSVFDTKAEAEKAGAKFVKDNDDGHSYRVDRSHSGLGIFDGLMNELLR